MWADSLTNVADILSSTQTDGEVRVNLGEQTDGSGFGADSPVYGIDGFAAMPNDPDENGACQALYLVDGNEKVVFGTRDNRSIAKVGALKPGDRVVFSNCDARVMLKKADNAVSLYTVNETAEPADGTAQMLDLRGSTGVTVLLNGGCIIQQLKDEVLVAINGGASWRMTEEGHEFFGQKFSINCSTVTIGLMPGGLPPAPGVNGAIYGISGVTGVASTSVTIAT